MRNVIFAVLTAFSVSVFAADNGSASAAASVVPVAKSNTTQAETLKKESHKKVKKTAHKTESKQKTS